MNVYELILTIVGTNTFTTIVTLWANRRLRRAEREAIVTDAATKVIDQLQDEIERILKQSDDYRISTKDTIAALLAKVDKLEADDRKTEDLLRKYYLALSIVIRQLKLAGQIEPLIDPNKIDTMTIEELKEIERSMSEQYYLKLNEPKK